MDLRFKLEKHSPAIEYIAKRIAGLISSDTSKAPQIFDRSASPDEALHSSDSYQLGESNDWWLRYYPNDNEIAVIYRYGGSHVSEMEALAEFIVKFLQLGWLNRPVTPNRRIQEIQGGDVKLTQKSSFSYSWEQGYEKLDSKHNEKSGGFSFSGSYHPNGTCEGGGVCKHCGKTL